MIMEISPWSSVKVKKARLRIICIVWSHLYSKIIQYVYTGTETFWKVTFGNEVKGIDGQKKTFPQAKQTEGVCYCFACLDRFTSPRALPLQEGSCRLHSAALPALARCSRGIPLAAPLQDNSYNTLLSGLPKLAASSAEGRAWFPFPLSQHLVEHWHPITP